MMIVIPLPIDLFASILEMLGYRDLLTCMQVCTLFRDLILGTASLQLTIELAVSGQIKHDTTVPPADCLNSLKKHQQSWRNATWTRELKVPMERGGLWELYGGVLSQRSREGNLIFTQLPSDLRGIKERTWSLGPDLGVAVRDFSMDPSQGLLVLIESPRMADNEPCYRVHLRSLVDGTPHPAVRSAAPLTLLQNQRDPDISYVIQISGEYLAVLFTPLWDGRNELAIWNWKTSELQLNLYGNDIRDVSLFSREHVLLGVVSDASEPRLVVVNFVKEDPELKAVKELECAHYFNYEPFVNGPFCSFQNMNIRADPGPSWKPAHEPSVSFSKDMTERIFVISLWVRKAFNTQCLTHFIPSNAITCHIGTADSDGRDYSVIEWKNWGPDKTRLILHPVLPSRTWVCYVYGQKYVVSDELTTTASAGYSGRLYDFNPLALRREISRGVSSTSDHVGCELNATTFKAGDIFLRDVKTHLLYYYSSISVEDAHGHCQAMCSEDNIILVDAECEEYRILVF